MVEINQGVEDADGLAQLGCITTAIKDLVHLLGLAKEADVH